MAMFELKTTYNGRSLTMVVRGKCITCVRNLAASAAGAEGPATWMDATRSTCELLRPDDRAGVLYRIEGDDDETT